MADEQIDKDVLWHVAGSDTKVDLGEMYFYLPEGRYRAHVSYTTAMYTKENMPEPFEVKGTLVEFDQAIPEGHDESVSSIYFGGLHMAYEELNRELNRSVTRQRERNGVADAQFPDPESES